MNYKLCRLYRLKSKKTLREWLGVNDSSFFHSKNIIKQYRPFLSKDGKKRLIEASSKELQAVQTKILGMLKKLHYPDYLFSGLKGKCSISNAKQHAGKYYVKVWFMIIFTYFRRG